MKLYIEKAHRASYGTQGGAKTIGRKGEAFRRHIVLRQRIVLLADGTPMMEVVSRHATKARYKTRKGKKIPVTKTRYLPLPPELMGMAQGLQQAA